MNPGTFKRMVVGALAQRWLSWEQAVTAMHQVVVLEAATSALKRLFNRIRRRTVLRELPMRELELAIAQEIERVWREMEARGEAVLSRTPLRSNEEVALATNPPQPSRADGLRQANCS
jgi:predicted nucleic acid-binding protein